MVISFAHFSIKLTTSIKGLAVILFVNSTLIHLLKRVRINIVLRSLQRSGACQWGSISIPCSTAWAWLKRIQKSKLWKTTHDHLNLFKDTDEWCICDIWWWHAVYPQWWAAYNINALLWPFIFSLAVIHILKPDKTKMTYFAIWEMKIKM